MKITTDHAASSYGIPVILDDDGEVMDPGPGLKTALAKLGMTRAEFAAACDVSPRTVDDWVFDGRISAAALNVLGDMLRKARKKNR